MGKKSRMKRERKAHAPVSSQTKELENLIANSNKADHLFKQLTTPSELTKPILDFCKTLSDQEPFFIVCEPEPWSRLGCCDMNVEEYTRQLNRGESVFGFRIWASGTAYVEAESHAIWRDENAYRDVSFSPDGEERILFLPVSQNFLGTFDAVPKKLRHAFSQKDAEAVKAYEAFLSQFVNQVEMPKDEAWRTMLTYEQWQAGKRMGSMVFAGQR